MIDAGHDIRRTDDHDEWLGRFETALRALPESQRQHCVPPLLDAYRKPKEAKTGAEKDIPHLPAILIDKYVSDLQLLGLV